MKFFRLSLLSVVLAFLSSCSSRQLSPEEADRSMKMLNGNLVSLFSAGQEKPEFKALKFLFNQTTSPLPFVVKSNPTAPDTGKFVFAHKKGIYDWDPNLKIFQRTGSSENVAILFPDEKSDRNDMRLNLGDYQSQAYSSRPDFPVLIDAEILRGDERLVTITHKANIKNNLPENISTLVSGKDYKVRFQIHRTQLNQVGKLFADIRLKTGPAEPISGKLEAGIEYSRQGYFFKTIRFELKLIDHLLKGDINYSAIDPTSSDYVRSFNSNSRIILLEGNKKVGDVVLDKTNNGELLDYFIRFSNNEKVLLSEYMPFLNKLLNLKY